MAAIRILLVDDDEACLQLVSDELARDGFQVVTAGGADTALARAGEDAFNLVIADFDSPGAGLALRSRVLERAPDRVPFVFLSTNAAALRDEMTPRLGDDQLLLKPPAVADLRRAVHASLGIVRTERGTLPGALDRILRVITAERETGVLTAATSATTKRVAFQDGRVIFAASSDQRDLLGQAYIRAGLVSEADLMAAVAKAGSQSNAASLAGALEALRKVTPEQSEQVFERQIRESVLDLFLWKSGVVEFVVGGVSGADRLYPIALDLRRILKDGQERRARWAKVDRVLPNRKVSFERVGEWPVGFPGTGGDTALAQLLEQKRSMEELFVELHGQDYAIGLRLADLVEKKVIRTVAPAEAPPRTPTPVTPIKAVQKLDVTEPKFELPPDMVVMQEPPDETATKETPVAVQPTDDLPTNPIRVQAVALFAEAMADYRDGNHEAAHAGFSKVLLEDPLNSLARDRLVEVERAIDERAKAAGLVERRRVKLALSVESLVGREIAPNDAFVLSRLAAGVLSIGDLISICPFPAFRVRAILQRHLVSGAIKLVE